MIYIKVRIGIIAIFIIILVIFLLAKRNDLSIISIPTQGNTPTSTSAPTPTSVYGNRTEKQTAPVAGDVIMLTPDGFSPKVLSIKAGSTVTWTNSSGSEATINSDPHPRHTAYPALNLGQFNDGDSLQLTFNKPGRYGYHNHFDATQTGTIIVQ